MMPVEHQEVEKVEEVADCMAVTFNNVDGEFLSREKIFFTRNVIADELYIEVIESCEYVRRCSSKEIYTEDFKLQVQDYLNMTVKELIWVKKF